MLCVASKPQTTCMSVLEDDFTTSARTSIYRKQASVPLRELHSKGLIKGSVLNFGKGKYPTDSLFIQSVVNNCTDYDYTYAPLNLDLLGGHFQTVYVGYVVNTLPLRSRTVVYQQVASSTRTNGGRAYFAVRSDKDKGIKGQPFVDVDATTGRAYEDGVITSKGTYQVGFSVDKLISETRAHFQYARSICYKAGYLIVECSHSPFDS